MSENESNSRVNRNRNKPGKRLAPREKKPIGFATKTVNSKDRKAIYGRMRKKDRAMLLIPIGAAVIAVVVLLLVYQKAVTYTLRGEAFQSYANATVRYAEGAELSRDKDDMTVIKNQKATRSVPNLPIYYEDDMRLVMPETVIYYEPRSLKYWRADYFTEFFLSDRGPIELTREKDSVSRNRGFIYDGRDLYVFLEPVEFRFNNSQISLPAFSYAEVVYGESVAFYNYQTGDFYMEKILGDVTATAGKEDYTLDLLTDTLSLNNGTKVLLFTRADQLDSVFGS